MTGTFLYLACRYRFVNYLYCAVSCISDIVCYRQRGTTIKCRIIYKHQTLWEKDCGTILHSFKSKIADSSNTLVNNYLFDIITILPPFIGLSTVHLATAVDSKNPIVI